PALFGVGGPRRDGGRGCREILRRRGLKLPVTCVRSEDVDLAVVDEVVRRVAAGGLAHARAHPSELNLVLRGLALERALRVCGREEVLESSTYDGEIRLSGNFLALHQQHWIEAVERFDRSGALRNSGCHSSEEQRAQETERAYGRTWVIHHMNSLFFLTVRQRQPTRSATIGSTDAARRAGTRHATAATATSTIDTATNVMPSV